MRSYQVILGLLFLVCGCSLLKQNSTATSNGNYEETERHKQYILSETDSSTNAVTMHYEKDSLQEAYMIQLWPKGRFSFSADGRFEGEADSILISGTTQRLLQNGELKSEKRQLKARKVTATELQRKLKLKQKDKLKKSNPDYRLLIGIVVLLIIAWRWLVKK